MAKEKSKYIGARYIGNEPLALGNGNGVSYGTVITSMDEKEAISRNDFEPVYSAPEKTGDK